MQYLAILMKKSDANLPFEVWTKSGNSNPKVYKRVETEEDALRYARMIQEINPTWEVWTEERINRNTLLPKQDPNSEVFQEYL